MSAYRCIQCGAEYDAHHKLCGSCFVEGWIIAVGYRRPAALDSEPEMTTAKELARTHWQRIQLRRHPDLKLCAGAFVLLSGAEGSGKSTLCASMLDGIDGPVLLASVEESPGPTLSARLLRAGVKRDDFIIVGKASVDQVVARLRQTKARAFAIDSIQPSGYTHGDLRRLLNVIDSLDLVVATAQLNREGSVAGVRALEHEADVHLRVDSMRWQLDKSRYQEDRPEGPVLPAQAATPEETNAA